MKSHKFFFGVIAALFVIGLFFFFFFGATSRFFAHVRGVERLPNAVGIVRVSSVVKRVVPGVVSVDKMGVVKQVVDGEVKSVAS
jgi:hypothetical protein